MSSIVSTHKTSGSHKHGKSQADRTFRGKTQAWWSVGEFMEPGITHQSITKSLVGPIPGRILGQQHDTDEIWDLSDSLADLYSEVNIRSQATPAKFAGKTFSEVEVKKWLSSDTNHGFIRIYMPDTEFHQSRLVPCSLTTAAHQICAVIGLAPNCLHVQLHGDIIRRLDPYEHPLMIQNEYLATTGYTDISRIQEEGINEELGFLVRFYSGKPFHDGTYSRSHLRTVLEVRKGKVLPQWTKKLCIISGTRLFVYKDKTKNSQPTVIQLAKGSLEEVKFKGRSFCLKLTSTLPLDKTFILSFNDEGDYQRWYKKAKKATSKLPTSADLSNSHLEFLPETLFINDDLSILNLRHNVLKERPIEDDIYTIGWLDDLPRFTNLRSLNLADNELGVFPLSVCQLRSLVELNLASNRLEDIPPQIGQLHMLQALHLHNNHLSQLPDDLIALKKLIVLVLAFNRFTSIPQIVANMTDVRISDIENLIMAGNSIEKLPDNLLMKLKYVKKIDFRMNGLTLSPNETVKFSMLEQLTHMDIRDNSVQELDIRGVRTLEYLTCERNGMRGLQLNGSSLKKVYAAHNELESFYVTPKPEWLETLELSHNRLERLPEWTADCFFLQILLASYNCLQELPKAIFFSAKKLKVLHVDHNEIENLPEEIDVFPTEELCIQHNNISALPEDFLQKANKLKVFNATNNKLIALPELNANDDMNKVQELYLTGNYLQDDSFRVIGGYSRLKVLHAANNDFQDILDRYLERLELLQELNLSGNKLRFLPEILGNLPELRVLRAHSNLLRSLPDLREAKNLKVLDVGCNRLLDVSVTDLMASQINLLDMSCNHHMKLNTDELKNVKKTKKVLMVDMTGQNRLLPGIDNSKASEDELPWSMGFSETNGQRNKLCITVIKDPRFRGQEEALFGMFDGGRNNMVPRLLSKILPRTLQKELNHVKTADKALRYSFLTVQRQLRDKGQRLGASAAVCYIKKAGKKKRWMLQVANAGDVGAVLCRGGEAVTLSRLHTVTADRDECFRIRKSSGIITEDSKVNGTSSTTRHLGTSYLFPQVIPEPSEVNLTLRRDDQFLIIANHDLWKYVSHQEAVQEVANVTHPVIAAKRLQDLAQSYGSKENISVLVVRLEMNEVRNYTDSTPSSEGEETIERRHRLKNGDTLESVMNGGYNADTDSVASESDPEFIFRSGSESGESGSGKDVQVNPLSHRRYRKKDDATEWEGILQQRISSTVKQRELKFDMCQDSEEGSSVSGGDNSENWSSLSKHSGKQMKAKISDTAINKSAIGSLRGRIITCPPLLPRGATLSDTNLNAGEFKVTSAYFTHKQPVVDSTENVTVVPIELVTTNGTARVAVPNYQHLISSQSSIDEEPGYATISYTNKQTIEDVTGTSEETLKADDDDDRNVTAINYQIDDCPPVPTDTSPVVTNNPMYISEPKVEVIAHRSDDIRYNDNIDELYAKVNKFKKQDAISDNGQMSVSEGTGYTSTEFDTASEISNTSETEDDAVIDRVSSITVTTHL